MKFFFLLLSYICSFIIIKCQWDASDYGEIITKEHKDKFLWGTYKPNLYYAVKDRTNTSTVFGIMWYGANKNDNLKNQGNITDRIRHECNMKDNLNYHWKAHDGENYGEQHIHDEINDLRLTTTFIKRNSTSDLQTWDTIITGDKLNKYYDKKIEKNNREKYQKENNTISLILYFSLENFLIEEKSYFKLIDNDNNDKSLNNENNVDNKLDEKQNEEENQNMYKTIFINHNLKGNSNSYFKVTILKSSLIDFSIQNYRKKYEDTWQVKKVISEELKNNELNLNSNVNKYAKFDELTKLNGPNIIALQLVLKNPFDIIVTYSSKKENLDFSRNSLNELRQYRLNKFNQRFDNSFVGKYITLKEIVKNNNDIFKLKTFMKEAVSNIFGGIGNYYGKIKIKFDEELPKHGYHIGFRYALDEKNLFTASPSRSFFARGFLWDEGFHNIIISSFNLNITVDILNSWLSTMSSTGYMAREQIRGREQEAQVDSKFHQQDKLVGNPPTFVFPVNKLIEYYKYNYETENLSYLKNFLKKANDKFSAWYEWFIFNQQSVEEASENGKQNSGFYAWKGRNSEHNLASGLDDFPRALIPNIYEKHLDLYLWIYELMKCLRNLAEIFDLELVQHYDTLLSKMKDISKEFYDKDLGILNDKLGPQFELIKIKNFKRKVFPINWRGDNKCGNVKSTGNTNPIDSEFTDCNPYSENNCCSEFGWCGSGPQFCNCPKCKKSKRLEELGLKKETIYNPHIGYTTFSPIIFGFLDKSSPEFENLLKYLSSNDEVYSPYGIRSLSKSDLLYHTGDDYWRGNIWINMNYLILRGLHNYYKDHTEATNIYNDLRNKIVKTVYDEWLKSGMFYEQYSDIDGKGLKARPFNGWTSLIVNIITEDYN